MILAIDIGGTYTKYGYVTGREVTGKGKWETVFSFPLLCQKIGELVRDDTERIAISSGGFWDADGTCRGYETIAETRENNLVQFLKNEYSLPVTIQNDARCALLCEKAYGTLADCRNAVLFVLGSSVGSAVLINGALYEGARKKAGMFFKMPESTEPYQYELASNTVKQAQLYREKFDLTACNMLYLEQQAVQGEKTAQDILRNYAQAVAKKLLFARLTFDPEKIAVGGGITNSERILNDIREEYKKLLTAIDEPEDIPIVKTAFGEDSNLIGAALEGCI